MRMPDDTRLPGVQPNQDYNIQPGPHSAPDMNIADQPWDQHASGQPHIGRASFYDASVHPNRPEI